MNKASLVLLPLLVCSAILFLYTAHNISAINWKIGTDWQSKITGYISSSKVGIGKHLLFFIHLTLIKRC